MAYCDGTRPGPRALLYLALESEPEAPSRLRRGVEVLQTLAALISSVGHTEGSTNIVAAVVANNFQLCDLLRQLGTLRYRLNERRCIAAFRKWWIVG